MTVPIKSNRNVHFNCLQAVAEEITTQYVMYIKLFSHLTSVDSTKLQSGNNHSLQAKFLKWISS